MPVKRTGRPTRKAKNRPTRRNVKRYGWIPDLPDQRDKVYQAPLAELGPLPPRVDLRSSCPPVYDQGALGSCTANAIAGALEFDQMKQMSSDVFLPARLFIYYNERVMEGTVDQDSGAMLRDGIKTVNKDGAPHETLWPYVISRFRTKPSPPAYVDARRHRALLYERVVRRSDQLRGCLASGYPFVFGFAVYESFEAPEVADSGHAPMPGPTEILLGGHAVLCVGYDDGRRWFIARNSWGSEWGMGGYFTLPYNYLFDPNLSDDFWKIESVACDENRRGNGRKPPL
jgi:C1A family cysteine protease